MAVKADTKIVVIGCGISGIAAGHRLVKAGFPHVRIIEATARSGGRVRTGRLGNNIVEIGASFIHGPSEENPVFCLARDYGLLDKAALNPENQAMMFAECLPWTPSWYSSSGQKLRREDMSPALDMYFELLNDTSRFVNGRETKWVSVGDFIRSEVKYRAGERWKDKDERTKVLLQCAVSARLKEECCSNAAHTMDEVDMLGLSLYKGLCGLDCEIPGGYDGLIKNLMSELPSDLVTYNQPVRCVHWSHMEGRENTVRIECDDGDGIAADHVIVTVPLGYLKKHHSTLFSPALPPHKLHSIQKMGFGTCNKIYLEFDSAWWDADTEVIYFLWEDEEDIVDQVSDISESWIRKMSVFSVIEASERHLLCGWIAGHESEYMESLPEQEVRSAITELIHTFTGDPSIKLRRILCTKWFHDPWTYGSFSHAAVGCSAQDLQNLMEPLPTKGSKSQPLQVLFAGEATHPCYFSTVHGALLSGWREADRLISHYSSIDHCG